MDEESTHFSRLLMHVSPVGLEEGMQREQTLNDKVRVSIGTVWKTTISPLSYKTLPERNYFYETVAFDSFLHDAPTSSRTI